MFLKKCPTGRITTEILKKRKIDFWLLVFTLSTSHFSKLLFCFAKSSNDSR